MLSTSLASPMRKPSREPCSTCGAPLMFSWPPAMTMSASPHLIACAARCVALSPLPQTLPIVMPGTLSGRPARFSACRAGFWPTPAVSTCPKITSEICSGCSWDRTSSARMIWAPKSAAGTLPMAPLNLPTADRTAAVMTTSFMCLYSVACRCSPRPPPHALLLQHVGSRRCAKGRVACLRRSRRLHPVPARVQREPMLPNRPPRPALGTGRIEPHLRREGFCGIQPAAHAVAAPRMTGTAHDTRIVAARCQQKREVGRARQAARLVDRLPWCNMIGLGADHEHRNPDRSQIDPPALRAELAARQRVIEIQLAQVFGMHAARHARAVRVPRHEIVGHHAFASQVGIDGRRPQKIARAQQRKCRPHLFTLEHAGSAHGLLQSIELARTDEHR